MPTAARSSASSANTPIETPFNCISYLRRRWIAHRIGVAQPVADERHSVAAIDVVVGPKRVPEDRFHTRDRGKVRADPLSNDTLRPIVGGERHVEIPERRESGEGRCLRLPGGEIRDRRLEARNRARASGGASAASNALIATRRSWRRSVAWNTAPMPPRPTRSPMGYCAPSDDPTVPGDRLSRA
jgi:hypothetical protein